MMKFQPDPSRQLPEFELCNKAAHAVNDFTSTSQHEVYLAAIKKNLSQWTPEEIEAISKFAELNSNLSCACKAWRAAIELMNKPD